MAEHCSSRPDPNGLPQMRSRPILRVMLEGLKSIVDWQTLMINMGMEKHEIDKIKVNNPLNVEAQKQDAFEKWLRQTPDACWKHAIDALYQMDENVLAHTLAKKYEPIDPRPSNAMDRLIVIPRGERVRVVSVDQAHPCRTIVLSRIKHGLDYYTLDLTRPLGPHDGVRRDSVEFFSKRIRPKITGFLESIERSDSKEDFRVGIEARFGKFYWRLPDHAVRWRPKDFNEIKSRSKGTVFYPEVEEAHIDSLLNGKESVGGTTLLVTLKFEIVAGEAIGKYVLLIDESGTFHLDAVYREPETEHKSKFDFTIPGRKYDFRIGDCSALLLLESEHSLACQIAREITSSMHRLPERKLSLILRGKTKGSTWEVVFIRQRVQQQYHWKPTKRWILATYDVDQFNAQDNPTVDLKKVRMGERVDITEFNLSRKEVELWAQKIFPKGLNKTQPSRDKYYHMRIQGSEGVKFPGENPQPPSEEWTTKEMMSDFDELLAESFHIATVLDSSPN